MAMMFLWKDLERSRSWFRFKRNHAGNPMWSQIVVWAWRRFRFERACKDCPLKKNIGKWPGGDV